MKNKRGITLIALVVSIIVLLILAGVSIAMLTGENGILNKAIDASKKTNDAGRKEKAELDRMSELIDETISGEQTVKQVTDKNPGVLEEEGDEKVINSIEDLVFFAWDVTNGNTYKGQNVKLGLSLDFNSSKSYVDPYRKDYGKYGYNGELKTLLTSGEGFIPIGSEFTGVFDGNNFKLYDLLICESEERDELVTSGMFRINSGKIENLGLESVVLKCNIIAKTACLGGLTGLNIGSITNCYVEGDMAFVSDSVNTNYGALVGSNNGTIGNSFVDVDLIFDAQSFNKEGSNLRIGGICGVNEGNVDEVEIKNVYNVGSVTVLNGELISNNHNVYFGGICGWNSKKISSSYSVAKLSIRNEHCVMYIGGCIGREQNSTGVNKNYYLENMLDYIKNDGIPKDCQDKSEIKTSLEMKALDFIALLNGSEENWTTDKYNINGGYPILHWQAEKD